MRAKLMVHRFCLMIACVFVATLFPASVLVGQQEPLPVKMIHSGPPIDGATLFNMARANRRYPAGGLHGGSLVRQQMMVKSAPVLQAGEPTKIISDDFNDNFFDTKIWSSVGRLSPVEKNGALSMNVENSEQKYIYTKDALLGDKCDISVTVDFKDFATTGSGIIALELAENQTTAFVALMKNGSQTVAYYQCYDGTSYNSDATTCTATSGSFKIIYHHDTQVLDCLFGQDGAWTTLGTSAGLPIHISEGMQCYLVAYADANSALTCSFDNFYAVGGAYIQPQLGETGLFKRVTYTSGSDSRDFRMVVPQSYRPDRPVGLLLGFHGNLGSTVMSEPYLSYLSGWLEDTAEEGYYLTVSLSVRKSGAGWSGGWNHYLTLSNNYDAKAVKDLVTYLKQYYAIDDDRIYASGHSNGGGFVMVLTNCLPDFFAVSAPNCPVPPFNPPANARHASCSVGGITDTTWGSTANFSRNINEWHKSHGTDADCWVFDMGHSFPPNDTNVSPSRPWADTLADYFVKHPRGFATRMFAPPSLVQPFHDDFTGSGTVPARACWHVQMFDGKGVLYGPVRGDGTPGVGVAGYKFRTKDDALETTATGTGLQGGLCSSGFLKAPFTWKTSFKIKNAESSLTVWPLTMGSMSGKVLALAVTPGGWSWQLTPTHLAFRANMTSSIQTLASGAATFKTGVAYDVQVVNSGPTLDWEIIEVGGSVVASGLLDSPITEPVECAFGLRGTGSVVCFDYAEATQPRSALKNWSMYQ